MLHWEWADVGLGQGTLGQHVGGSEEEKAKVAPPPHFSSTPWNYKQALALCLSWKE